MGELGTSSKSIPFRCHWPGLAYCLCWVVLFSAATLGTAVSAHEPATYDWIHPFEVEQPPSAPSMMLALIEIQSGSRVKYEIDPAHGGLVADRFLPASHPYPFHYGGLPSWEADDGDLMDVIVITDVPLHPASFVPVVPIGLALMTDGGIPDHKVLAIPATEVPLSVRDTLGLEAIDGDVRQTIETFFGGYKQRPDGINPIQWQGFADREEVVRRYCLSKGRVVSEGVCLAP